MFCGLFSEQGNDSSTPSWPTLDAAADLKAAGSLTVREYSNIAIASCSERHQRCEQPQEAIISRYLKGWNRSAIRTGPIETPLREAAHRLPRVVAPSL
jgi:hypothetical protein